MSPLYAAALVVLLEALCFTTAFPVLSYYAQQFGGDAAWIGILFGLVSWPKVISNPIWGTLSERLGRRPVLAINTLGTLAGSVGWAIAPNLAVLAWSRALVGIFGGQAGLAQAVAADVSPPERRAAAMGVLGGAFALSLAIGPLVGGIVAQTWSHAMVGWVCAVFQVMSLAVILLFLPETRRSKTLNDSGPDVSLPPLIRKDQPAGGLRADILILLAVTLVLWTGLSTLNSTYGVLCEYVYGFDVRQTGYALAAMGVGLAIVQGGVLRLLTKRVSERALAITGIIVLVWGLATLAKPPPLWGLWLGTGLYALGVALATPCLTGLLTRIAPDDRQGAVAGWNQGVIALGRGMGNWAGGALYKFGSGPRMPYLFAAGVSFLALLAIVLLVRPARSGNSATAIAEPG